MLLNRRDGAVVIDFGVFSRALALMSSLAILGLDYRFVFDLLGEFV